MNKIGKVIRTRCVCGKFLNGWTVKWQGATKEQCQFDHKLSEKGLLVVKIILCPDCLKLAKDKQEGK